jgi:ADP-ribose pyrophosphatase
VGGTGCQPVHHPSESRPDPDRQFIPFSNEKAIRITKRNLPHWRQDGATYFVTYRLGDSVPAATLEQWNQERDIWMCHHPEPWDGKTLAEYRARFWEAREAWLDQGYGSCALKHKAAAAIVAESLRYFDGVRYVLDGFVIMPNHVHALVKPLAGFELSAILHTWKSYTGNRINEVLRRSGELWMDESHNHIVRDWAELKVLRRYVEENPKKANLGDGESVLEMSGVLYEQSDGGQREGTKKVSEETGRLPVPPTGWQPVLRSELTIPEFELCEIADHDAWKKLPGKFVYSGPYVQIEECSFLTPARPATPVHWTVAHRKAAVAVAPRTEDGRFILIHQERLPVQRALWEFPAGQLDDGETQNSIIATLLRELDEEAGCEPFGGAVVTPLGWFFGSQGFTGEHVYLFAVGPVRIVRAPQPVGGEHIGEVRLVTADELREMVASQVIQDALTLALFARMAARGMV